MIAGNLFVYYYLLVRNEINQIKLGELTNYHRFFCLNVRDNEALWFFWITENFVKSVVFCL